MNLSLVDLFKKIIYLIQYIIIVSFILILVNMRKWKVKNEMSNIIQETLKKMRLHLFWKNTFFFFWEDWRTEYCCCCCCLYIYIFWLFLLLLLTSFCWLSKTKQKDFLLLYFFGRMKRQLNENNFFILFIYLFLLSQQILDAGWEQIFF